MLLVSVLVLAGCGEVDPTDSTASSVIGTVPVTEAPIVTTTIEAESVSQPPSLPGLPPPIRRVDLVAGAVVWEVPANELLDTATMLVDDDGAVVGINDGCGAPRAAVYAREDGALLGSLAGQRTLAIDALVHRVGLVDGLLVVPVGDRREPLGLAAFAVDDGGERWYAEMPGLVAMDATTDAVIALSVEPEGPGRLTRFDRRDGSVQWSTPVDGDARWLVVGDVSVIVGFYLAADAVPEEVGAFDLDDGTQRWRRPLAPGSDRGSVEPAGRVVVGFDPASDETVALDAASGEERWRVGLRLPQRGDGEIGKRIVDGDTIYLESDSAVHALDVSSGSERWQRSGDQLGTGDGASLTGAGTGVVFVDGVLLSAVDGSELARITAQHATDMIGDEPNTRVVITEHGAYLLSDCPGAS